MKSLRAAFVISCVLSIACGQWLEKGLPLVDGSWLPKGSLSLAYISRDNTVYMSGTESDSIVVIDAQRCKPIGELMP